MTTQQRRRAPAKRRRAASEREYRGPRHEWLGWTPTENWIGNPAVAPQFFGVVKESTNFPFSPNVLQHVLIELRIIENVRRAGEKRRAERAGKIPAESFTRLPVTAVHHATGHARRVVRDAYDSLVASGVCIGEERNGRQFFRTREIGHEKAVAFVEFAMRRRQLPPEEWWEQSGTQCPTSATDVKSPMTSGTEGPSDGHLVPDRWAPSARQNGETADQSRGSGPEELPEVKNNLSKPSSPPPSSGSGSGGTDRRPTPPGKDDPALMQDDGGCADCGAELPAHVVDAIRGAWLSPDAPTEWKRWSHRSIDGHCP